MGEVKRYIADVATCVDVIPVESVSNAKFVLATDYATLEAELAKLRAELERRVPDGWRELLQEVAEYAPPYGTIVAMTSQMALGSKARRMLAAAPSAPKADDPVKVQLLEALEAAEKKLCIAEYHLDRGEDDSVVFESEILLARAAIAAARKGDGE